MAKTRTVVFVCEHGAAKSVVAAALLERLAAEHGEEIRALARGTEPDPTVSAAAAAGLLADGIDVRGWRPRPVTTADVASAWRIVSFGPDLAGFLSSGRSIERWQAPPVGEDFRAARATILEQLPRLLAEDEVA